MCWITNKKIKIKKAKTDLTVFKIVNVIQGLVTQYESYYYGGTYVKDMTYDGKIIIEHHIYENYSNARVDEAFHSYFLTENHIKTEDNEANKFISIGKKSLIDCYKCYQNTAIVKCTIPKGSHFMINERGEIVSEKIALHNCILITESEKKLKTFVTLSSIEKLKWFINKIL